MATKNSTSFDRDQTKALADGVTGIINSVSAVLENEVKPIFAQLKGDDVIGESDTKVPLMEAITQAEQAMTAVFDKLGRMQKAIETVCEATGVAVNKNIQSTEEATQVVAAAKKKVEESTGKNA
jgi:hypothetical protein